MSERGSFATSVGWCLACHATLGTVLAQELRATLGEPDFTVREAVFYRGDSQEFQRGMWYGIVRSTYAGGEIHIFDDEVNPQLQAQLCHPLQLVVFAESGETQVFSLLPTGWMEDHPPAPPVDVVPAPPPPAIMFPVTSLGDTLHVTHVVEAFQSVTYQVPLFIDPEGTLVCETVTTTVPSEVRAVPGQPSAPGGQDA